MKKINRRDFLKISLIIAGGLIINQMFYENNKEKQVFQGGFKDIENSGVKGSLHSHGCWTDYRNENEQRDFPFDLKTFSKYCISQGRDFQAITDIMAFRPGKPEFIEKRYDSLLKTANPRDNSYEVQKNKTDSLIYFPKEESKLIIPRTQEILTDVHFKHILAVGTEEDIRGGRNAVDTLKEIRDLGGYSILDHTFMCNAWDEEEVKSLYEDKLIIATEFNGGLTFPAICDILPIKTPNKRSNQRVISLEQECGIPCIANDDSHSAEDIKKGAFTSYKNWNDHIPFIKNIVKAIQTNQFKRYENYSSFFSPLIHVWYGGESQKTFGEKGLPDA